MLQHSKPRTKRTLAKAEPTPPQTDKPSSKKPASRQKQTAPLVNTRTPEQRQKMIEEAAYYVANRRGFIGGNPLEDWLEAEAEIDKQLSQKAR